MADKYGVNFTKLRNTPKDLVEGGQYGGRVRARYDSYVTATFNSGDILHIGKLGPGETFLFGEVHHGALGTGCTLKFGVTGDDDKFKGATAVATAGKVALDVIGGIGYRNTTNGPLDIIATLAGANANDSIDIKAVILTVRD